MAPGIKMEHFELTQDPEGIEEPKGMQRSLFFVPNPYTIIWVSTDSPEQLRFGILN